MQAEAFCIEWREGFAKSDAVPSEAAEEAAAVAAQGRKQVAVQLQVRGALFTTSFKSDPSYFNLQLQLQLFDPASASAANRAG